MTLVRFLLYVLLLALTIMKVLLAQHFWQALEQGDPGGGRHLVAIGCALAVAAVFMLAAADQAHRAGARKKALAWRLLFLLVVPLDMAADVGAVSMVTAADQARRTQAEFVRQEKLAIVARAEREIERLRRRFPEPQYDQPSAALAALLAERQQRLQLFEARNWAPPQDLLTRIARLQAAAPIAARIEALSIERDRANAWLVEHQAEATTHPQFTALAALLTSWGLRTDAEQVRVGLAFYLALGLTATLTIGWWAVGFGARSRSASRDWSGALWARANNFAYRFWPRWPFRGPMHDFRARYPHGAPVLRPARGPMNRNVADDFDDLDPDE
jgi:hypothetical protein